MSELVYRRVAGGRDPDRDVLQAGADGGSRVWRSRGAAAGRFETRPGALARVRAAIADVAGVEVPAAFAGASPGSDVVAEHLSLGGATLAAPAGTAADGPWGELLAACRAAVDDPGEPVAVVAVVAEPPSRVRLEHRGREPLELGLGALVVAIRWGGPGLATTWAEVRVTEGVVVAGPGWSRTLDVVAVSDPAPGADPGGTASLSARDEGAWIPVSLTEPPPDG